VSWQLAWVVQLFVEGTRHSSISEINKVFLIYFDLMEVLVIVAKSSKDVRNDIKTPLGGSSLFFMFSLVGNFLSI
jgi:hypothetical protein